MAVRIRLSRFGRKDEPRYRITVADSKRWRDGKFLEHIGTYNPTTNPAEIKLDREKYEEWISKGAQPSDTVKSLYKKTQ